MNEKVGEGKTGYKYSESMNKSEEILSAQPLQQAGGRPCNIKPEAAIIKSQNNSRYPLLVVWNQRGGILLVM